MAVSPVQVHRLAGLLRKALTFSLPGGKTLGTLTLADIPNALPRALGPHRLRCQSAASHPAGPARNCALAIFSSVERGSSPTRRTSRGRLKSAS